MHEALEELARVDARLVQVVEMRYFAGMTEPEIAAALGVNDRTVRRDWQKARLLLADALKKDLRLSGNRTDIRLPWQGIALR